MPDACAKLLSLGFQAYELDEDVEQLTEENAAAVEAEFSPLARQVSITVDAADVEEDSSASDALRQRVKAVLDEVEGKTEVVLDVSSLEFKVLRTWMEDDLEDVLEYRYQTRKKYLFVWNVYKMTYGDGQQVEEKWTENAGFWVEKPDDNSYIFHCSHGGATPPDFESLVFRADLRPLRLN